LVSDGLRRQVERFPEVFYKNNAFILYLSQ